MTRKRRVERKVTAVHTKGYEAWQYFHNIVNGIGVLSFTPQPLYPTRITPRCTVNKAWWTLEAVWIPQQTKKSLSQLRILKIPQWSNAQPSHTICFYDASSMLRWHYKTVKGQ
jgi:hypothetical protein